MKELLLGCGNRRERSMCPDGWPREYQNLVTVDIDPNCGADILFDLSTGFPLPFAENEFDSISMHEVLEHLGPQGNYQLFFRQMQDYWRVLKPGGLLFATVPRWDRMWSWADPGHTRCISHGTLIFLDQDAYRQQVDNPATRTAMTDYRWCYQGDFKTVHAEEKGEQFFFILQARKAALSEAAVAFNERAADELFGKPQT